MITQQEMQQIIDYTVSRGAEFCELFLEDRMDQELRCAKQNVQAVKNVRVYGAGLRLINGLESVYTYTNDVTLRGLLDLAEEALSLAGSRAASGTKSAALSASAAAYNPNPVQCEPDQAPLRQKVQIVKAVDAAAASAGVPLLGHQVVYSDTDQRIWIANSEGILAQDRRVNTRARAYYTVGDGRSSLYEWADYVKPCGMEAWESDEPQQYFRRQLRSSYTSMKAEPIKACTLPVVMAAGSCGALWHECCGHTLEAAAIADGNSDFIGKIGQRVASSRVTLIDDGTLPGLL